MCVSVGGVFGAERGAAVSLHCLPIRHLNKIDNDFQRWRRWLLIVVIVVGRTTKWWHVIGINEYGNLPSSIRFIAQKTFLGALYRSAFPLFELFTSHLICIEEGLRLIPAWHFVILICSSTVLQAKYILKQWATFCHTSRTRLWTQKSPSNSKEKQYCK